MSPAKVVQGNGGRVRRPGGWCVCRASRENVTKSLENLKAWNEYTHQKISCWRFRSRSNQLWWLHPKPLGNHWLPTVPSPKVYTGNGRFCPRVYCVWIMFPSDPITWEPGPSLLCFPMSIDSSPRSKIAAPNIQQLRRCRKIIKTKKKVWRIRASIIARLWWFTFCQKFFRACSFLFSPPFVSVDALHSLVPDSPIYYSSIAICSEPKRES